MNEHKVGSTEEKRLPSCNVNQTFNYTVGGIALIAAAAIYYLFFR
jgi:hypothetical protein